MKGLSHNLRRLACMLLLTLSTAALGQTRDFDYRLSPQQVADGVYVLIGKTEDFSLDNGGDIVNTGFIIGREGVIVIDTGSSKRYGEQMRAAIARLTPLPIVLVINTHHHPDHFLGNQAFAVDTLAALADTRRAIEAEGAGFLDNMYRLNGDWMRDTEVAIPRRTLTAGPLEAGGRKLELVALGGHTVADLAVLDTTTGTLFAADLVFNKRAPTTPHAEIKRWLQSLDQLQALRLSRLVPGHGEVTTGSDAIEQTRQYLQWLDQTLRDGAEQGLDMTEMLALTVPDKFAGLAEVRTEFRRSVTHLYPAAEQAALQRGR